MGPTVEVASNAPARLRRLASLLCLLATPMTEMAPPPASWPPIIWLGTSAVVAASAMRENTGMHQRLHSSTLMHAARIKLHDHSGRLAIGVHSTTNSQNSAP
jgi:hypothetical protein